MIKKRLIITSVISILLVAVLMLGSTYSIFTTSEIDENANVYTTGNLKVTYALGSGNVKITDSSPMTVEEADAVKPYRITVNNTGTVPYMFDVTLTDTTSSIDNTIDYQYIMTKVGYLEPKKLSNCANNVIKEDVIVPAGESVDIDVRVWLGSNLSNSEMGKSFYGKLSIDGLAIYDDSTDIDNDILSLRYMNTSSTSDFRNDTYKTYIKEASFVDYIDTSNASLDADNNPIQWDMSTAQDNSIIAWLEPNTEEGYYNLYIGSKKKIYAKSLQNFFDVMVGLIDINFNNLDTSLTVNMVGMFYGCSSLTSLDLSSFNTSNVNSMNSYQTNRGMFHNCSSLTSLDLSSFNTSKVTSMFAMFQNCSSLESLDVSSFDTSNVTEMRRMFSGCSRLTNLDLGNFNTSNVTLIGGYNSGMFQGCSSLTSLDLSSFDTSNINEIGWMFQGCSSLTSLDLSGFDTSGVTYIGFMFDGCSSLINIDLSSFDTSNVTSMAGMFQGCSSLISLDLSSFDTSNVTRMDSMFKGCSSLITLNISNFNTINVSSMLDMFYDCSNLATLDLSNFNTSNVTSMAGMFRNCSNLTTIDLSSFDTSNVTDMTGMFYRCSSLVNLDINNFDTTNTIKLDHMFNFCNKIVTTITIRNANSTYSWMFSGAATDEGTSVTVNYIGDDPTTTDINESTEALVEAMIATGGANVVKGSLVS